VLECALEVVVRQRVVFSPQLEEGSVVVQNRAVFGFCGVEVTELSTNQQHTLSGFCAHSSQVLMRVVKTVVKTVLKTEVKTEPVVKTVVKSLVKTVLTIVVKTVLMRVVKTVVTTVVKSLVNTVIKTVSNALVKTEPARTALKYISSAAP